MAASAPDRQGLRFEVKMTAPEPYAPRVRSAIRVHPSGLVRAYPPRWINNVYLDTENLDLLAQSRAGVSDRCKARFRWYGELADATAGGSLELKIKKGALGSKRRFRIPTPVDLTAVTWRHFMKVLRHALPPEDARTIVDGLRPVLINRYHREYACTPDREIFVTLDVRQGFWSQWLGARPNLSRPSPGVDWLVVEVKGPASSEDRVAQVLAGMGLSRSRNSKFVSGLEASVEL